MFRRKPKWDKPFPEKIARRVSRIPNHDLITWANQAMYETSRALSAYERDQNGELLKDVITGTEALHALINEIYKRNNAKL